MTGQPGVRIGGGRAADVYDQGDGTVLRRYRSDRPTEPEARIMTWLRERGINVPEVHAASGRDIVMDLVDGPTMMQDLEKQPWLVLKHARILAALQKQINELQAPDWVATLPGISPGAAVLHLDLHPMNVILAKDGPVIIDWTNASRGAASFDAAMTYVLGATFAVSKRIERVGQRAFVEAFAVARGRRSLRKAIPDAAQYRLLDPNTTDAERALLHRLLGQSGEI